MKILIEVEAPGWDGSIPAAPKELSMDLQLMAYIKALIRERIEREPIVHLQIFSDAFVVVNADQLLSLQAKCEELYDTMKAKSNCNHANAQDLGGSFGPFADWCPNCGAMRLMSAGKWQAWRVPASD